MNITELSSRTLSLIISAVILLLLLWFGWQLISHAPAVKQLTAVHIKANSEGKLPVDGVVLGWNELGQYPGANSAEKAHLKVSHNPASGWHLQNVATHKRIDAQTDLIPTRYVRRFSLKSGDRLESQAFTLLVENAENGRLILKDANTGITAEWLGTRLAFSDQRTLYDACEQSDWLRRTVGRWRDQWQWGGRENIKDEKRLFTVGGQVDCTTRWQQKGLPPNSLRFSWMAGRFWVGPGSGGLRLRIVRGNDKYDLGNVPLAVSGDDGKVSRLIMGRTHYALTSGADHLSLKPTRNLPVTFIDHSDDAQQDEAQEAGTVGDEGSVIPTLTPEQQAQQQKEAMEARGIFPIFSEQQWIGAIPVSGMISRYNLLLALGVTILLVWLTIGRRGSAQQVSPLIRGVAVLITLGLAGSTVLLAHWGFALSALLLIAWVTACWATVVQFITQRLSFGSGLVWWPGMLLAGIGLLVLTQLSAGSGNTRWLGFPYQSAFWISFLSIWVSLLALSQFEKILKALMNLLSPERRWLRLKIGRFDFSLPHPAYLVLILGVFVLLISQAVGGKEEGVFGIQPVELAKLLFVIIMARLLWYWQSMLIVYSGHFQQNKYRIAFLLLLPISLAILFAAFILIVGVNDNSPLFIIGWLTLAFMWLTFIDPLERWSRMQLWGQGSIALLILMLVITGIYAYHNPPGYETNFPQAERIRIWADPTGHPEAASQLLNSLQRVGEGGWDGTDWFGKNAIVMTLPAVQDDFIAAFLLNRFGGLVAIFLVLVQFCWLWVLFGLARSLDTIEAYAEVKSICRLIACVLYGLAVLHLLHWAISWSNVLGWLPIMGQPMTWLSAGNSHMLAIGVSTLLLGLVGSWIMRANSGSGA